MSKARKNTRFNDDGFRVKSNRTRMAEAGEETEALSLTTHELATAAASNLVELAGANDFEQEDFDQIKAAYEGLPTPLSPEEFQELQKAKAEAAETSETVKEADAATKELDEPEEQQTNPLLGDVENGGGGKPSGEEEEEEEEEEVKAGRWLVWLAPLAIVIYFGMGAIVFHVVEDLNFTDSMYLVVVTITTVVWCNHCQPLTDLHRLVTEISHPRKTSLRYSLCSTSWPVLLLRAISLAWSPMILLTNLRENHLLWKNTCLASLIIS